MVGQGVLRECLLNPGISAVQTVGRSPSGELNPKLREIVQSDMFHYERIEAELGGFDACFFCLGISSVGPTEEAYENVTYRLTLAAAQTLARLNSAMTFIYVSGVGTDSSEKGKLRWARVKGKTENALLRLPFKAAYMFRPGVIQAMHGEQPRRGSARFGYNVLKTAFPLLHWFFPRSILTTEEIGRAMIQAAKAGYPKKILEPGDIKDCAAANLVRQT
jgi:uncharacterized protein YbjT (DUF2867 family)